MEISLETIQDLAPDQASLSAAKKLLKPAKWPMRGKASSINCIWGQCQGSGANPYYTMADVVDQGYKCTCPSRKFPCKHVLALMWQFAEGASEFAEGDPPDWVNDWLGRRRKSGGTASAEEKPKIKKDISLVEDEQQSELSPEEIAKKEAAKEKRSAQLKAETEAGISNGLNDFQQWVNDQLRTGIGTFIKEINNRCRQIAARLVDAKATNLASRIDEMPAKILSLSLDQQPVAVLKEFGQLVLLSEAWFADMDDPDTRRAIASTENRDQLFSNHNAIKKSGIWETLGEQMQTRKDGLVSHSRWLMNIESTSSPEFALLLDYFPAASGAGKRGVGYSIGSQIKAELVFYPSRVPLRAVIAEQEVIPVQSTRNWQNSGSNLWTEYSQHLRLLPWSEICPCLLGAGRILLDSKRGYWWQNVEASQCLPLTNNELNPVLLGCDLQSSFVIWNGEHAELFSAHTEQWGTIPCL